tara:strand:+ start:62 stop:745 length:684 start_codon:yes stop_codon:yes gene_type:complete
MSVFTHAKPEGALNRKSDESPYMGKNAFGLFSNNRLEILTLYSFAFIGILIKLVYNSNSDPTGQQGQASLTLWGYGLAIISLLCIIFIHLGLTNKEIKEKEFYKNKKGESVSYLESISMFFHSTFSYILYIIVLVFIMLLNYFYYNKINMGAVSSDYNSYSSMSTILVLITLLVIYQYINITIFKSASSKHAERRTIINSILYLLCTVNVIFILIMYILLKFYSTDG